MGDATCKNSRILSKLLFFIIIDSVSLTRQHIQTNTCAAAIRLQDIPTLTRRENLQQGHGASASALPSPSKTPTDTWTLQGFERQEGASIHYLTPQLPRQRLNIHAEVTMKQDIQQILQNYEHNVYIKDEYETVSSETLSKATSTTYLKTKRNAMPGRPLVTTTRSTTPTENPSPQMSTIDNMLLCDHPPETFSSSFLGSSWEPCLQYDRKKIISFTNPLEVCRRIYTWTENNPQPFTIGVYHLGGRTLTVMTHQNFVQSCLPLFRRFNDCEERDFLTICWEEEIVFYHTKHCPHSSNDIFLAAFLLKNDTYCFQEFCEGWQSVVDSEVSGLEYRLTNTRHNLNSPSCGYMTEDLSHILRRDNRTLYIYVNNHWPCCYPLYLVIWADLPEAYGLNGAWSYLPLVCQAGEVLLLVLVGCVMVGGIVGNLLVLVVMVSGGHHGQESNLLRTSLAFANLLTATFIVVPSFVQHLLPFISSPHYFKVAPDMRLTSSPVNATSSIYLTNALHGWSGFPLFQSIVFHATSTVSLLMLLVLSLERFVITGRFLRYRDYFSNCRTMVAIIIAWITSLANALWFAAYEEGGLGAQWLTFEKLPTGASGFGPSGPRDVIFHGQFVIFLMLGISTVAFSALAIQNYVKDQLHVAAEWRRLKMKASRQYSQDNRQVLATMTLMLVLFISSCLPLAINITINSVFYRFQQHTLFSYISWWLFMAASAWNPWIYNLRSHQFKEDIRKLRNKAKQACWQQQPCDDPAISPLTNLQFESLHLATRNR